MIIAIEGELLKKEPTLLHVKSASGLIYAIRVSLNCSSKIEDKNIFLHTTLIIRDDAHILFGFLDEDEKKIFDRVLKINGVGPNTALAICSTFNPKSFQEAIISQDIDALKSVPGIGAKSAKRILVELGDFNLELKRDDSSKSFIEASLALESLGFKKESIKKALKDIKSGDTQTLIKEALKKLTK